MQLGILNPYKHGVLIVQVVDEISHHPLATAVLLRIRKPPGLHTCNLQTNASVNCGIFFFFTTLFTQTLEVKRFLRKFVMHFYCTVFSRNILSLSRTKDTLSQWQRQSWEFALSVFALSLKINPFKERL